jgi:hypothetical protein
MMDHGFKNQDKQWRAISVYSDMHTTVNRSTSTVQVAIGLGAHSPAPVAAAHALVVLQSLARALAIANYC